MSTDAKLSGPVPRFAKSYDEPDELTCDCVWTDRLTGKIVLRYDAGDPANTSAAYGARPDSEVLAAKGCDVLEEIDASQAVVPISPGEIGAHAAAKARRERREREEAEARDLFEFLGSATCAAFSFDRWDEGEQLILRPALEALGFTDVSFYMGEQDSFGPLSRFCVAFCVAQGGQRVRFFYG